MARTDLIELIHTSAPKPPACFESRNEWTQWLVSAHAAGMKVVRRVDVGKHRGQRQTRFEVLPVGQQSHCAECSKARRERMEGEGRCFPVRPPAAAQAPAPQPQAKRQPRFEVEGFATLTKARLKRVNDDVLAVVLGVMFPKLDAGVCAYFDEFLCMFLYRQTVGGRIVRNEALKPVSYARQLRDATVEIDRVTFPRADVAGFVVSPIDGNSVALQCSVTLYPGRANFSQLLGRYQQGVRMRIVGAPDLFDDEPEQPKSAEFALT